MISSSSSLSSSSSSSLSSSSSIGSSSSRKSSDSISSSSYHITSSRNRHYHDHRHNTMIYHMMTDLVLQSLQHRNVMCQILTFLHFQYSFTSQYSINFNSLAPGRCDCDLQSAISKHMLPIKFINAAEPLWWLVNISSDNGLVSSNNQSFSEPTLAQIFLAILCR